MSKWTSAKESGFYDPDAIKKDADVTIKASELSGLRAQLLEARAVQERYREGVEHLALRCKGFASWAAERGDKKTKEIWEREGARLESLLSLDPGRYAKAVQGVIEAAEECLKSAHPNSDWGPEVLRIAIDQLRAAEKGET